MVTIDMSARIEVERPGGIGVWIVRPLTYREFVEFAIASNSVEDLVSNLEQMMHVCKVAVVAYRVDGKEHKVEPEQLESAGVSDIVACFRAVMTLSKVDADAAGK